MTPDTKHESLKCEIPKYENFDNDENYRYINLKELTFFSNVRKSIAFEGWRAHPSYVQGLSTHCTQG